MSKLVLSYYMIWYFPPNGYITALLKIKNTCSIFAISYIIILCCNDVMPKAGLVRSLRRNNELLASVTLFQSVTSSHKKYDLSFLLRSFWWCRRRDLNPHEVALTGFWVQRVCHSTTSAWFLIYNSILLLKNQHFFR